MRAIVGLWRWRGNPLRRTTDLVEGLVALAAGLVIAVAAPLVGVAVGAHSHDALHEAVREQHRLRHRTTATVTDAPHQRPLPPNPETAAEGDGRTRVSAVWLGPDGTQRSGTALTELTTPHPGDRFPVWTDASGRIVPRPMPAATASAHAVLAGVGAAAATGALVEAARRLTVWCLVRLRHAAWDESWARVGPDWGRTTGTGS
ncbi:Rv1733c family protein [Streptomyces sp. NPDC002851]